MKSKWNLFSSIFDIVIGLLGVISFFIILFSGEEIGKWIITLILSITFIVLGVIGLIEYKKG